MNLKVKRVIKLLEEDGWYQVRHKGSHRQFHHLVKTGTVTVNGKPSDDLNDFLVNSIFKQAKLR